VAISQSKMAPVVKAFVSSFLIFASSDCNARILNICSLSIIYDDNGIIMDGMVL